MRKRRVVWLLLFTPACAPAIGAGARDVAAGSGLVTIPELARIDGGTFLMGSPIADPDDDGYRPAERPRRPVRVETFWLGRFLVTAEEFCVFLNEVGNDGWFVEETGPYDSRTIQRIGEDYAPIQSRPLAVAKRPGDRFAPQPGAERAPAYPVTWRGANAYCAWLSRQVGGELRLPTEAEWEFAARGPELRAWPWGNEPPLLVDHTGARRVSWYALRRARDGAVRLAEPFDARLPSDQLYGPRWIWRTWKQHQPWPEEPVGSFPRNATPAGVHDMLGYWCGEWCSDRAEQAIARMPGTPEPVYVTRGLSDVVVGYDEGRQGVTLGKILLAVLTLSDEGPEDHTTEGRSWSRVGENERAGAAFRVASSTGVAPRSR